MTIDDLLDSYSIDGFEVEMSMIETYCRCGKALKKLKDLHAGRRDNAQRKAKEALDNGDHESYDRWMEIFWTEDSKANLIKNTLAE